MANTQNIAFSGTPVHLEQNLRLRKRRARTICSVIESLEKRQLMSITASSLLGDSIETGTVETYQAISSGTVVGTSTRTVIGDTTFNGNAATESDTVTHSSNASANTLTDKDYGTLTSDGYVDYGDVSSTTNSSGGIINTDSDTYSPAQLVFPATIEAGTPYTSSVNETDVSTEVDVPGSTPDTNTDTDSETIELTSETPVSVTVPAGTYNAYLFNVTDTTTDTTDGDSGTPSSDTTQEWIAPGVGLVKTVSGTGTDTFEDDLASTTGSGGDGGGGGGGTTTTGSVTPLVLKTTLPASVVSGSTTKGTATVVLSNTTDAKIKESVTIDVDASADGAVDSASVNLGTLTKTVTINANSSANEAVAIKSIPASLNGTYSILASATDSSGTSSSTTGPSLTASAPFVAFSNEVLTTNLTGSIVSGSRTKDAATLTLTNLGNVASTGSTTVDLLVSPDGTAASGTNVRTFPESIVIQPSKSKTVKFALDTLPTVQNGTYQVVVELTDPKGNVTSVAAATTVSLAQPFLTLTPVLSVITPGAKGTGTVSLTITNNGNIEPKGAATVVLYASLTSSIDGATQLSTGKVSVPLQPGKSKTIKYHLTAATMSSLAADGILVAAVTDPLGGVLTAFTAG